MKPNIFTNLKNRWLNQLPGPSAAQSVAADAVCLEDRVLYSAVPFDVPAEPVDWSNADELAQVSLDGQDLEHLEFVHPGDAGDPVSLIESLIQEYDSVGFLPHDDGTTAAVQNVVFINHDVDQIDQLIADFSGRGSAYQVFVLDGQSDGVQQITNILENYSDLASVHLISHGSNGQVILGNSALSLASLDQHQDQLASWQDELSLDADILFYGCDFAGSDDGQQLIDTIAELTGADIAASDDVTGHESLGGDWDLEYVYGDLEASIVVSEDFQSNWLSTLPTAPTITVTGDATVTPGETYSLDLSLTDPDLDVINHWTVVWGDGTQNEYLGNIASQTVNHVYTSEGLFDITVSVEDATGTYHNSMAVVPSQYSDDLNFYDIDGNLLYSESGGGALDGPESVTMGPDGLLYVSSFVDGSIKMYDTAGNFQGTFFDTGADSAAQIDFDAQGNLYVANWAQDTVWRIDRDGNGSIIMDSSDGLNGPTGLAIRDGNLYISNWYNDNIVTADLNGNGAARFDVTGSLNSPSYLTFGTNGELYVADQSNDRVNVYDTDGFYQRSITDPSIQGGGLQTRGVTIGPDGYLYVTAASTSGPTSSNPSVVMIFDPITGTLVDSVPFLENAAADFQFPHAVYFTPQLQVTAITDPLIDVVQGDNAFLENDSDAFIVASAEVLDGNQDFNGGSLTVSISGGAGPNDYLAVDDPGSGEGNIWVSGSNVRYNPIGAGGARTIGTINASSTNTNLIIDLNSNADADAVERLIENITFGNASETPTGGARSIDFAFDDGTDGPSNVEQVNITVTPVDDRPYISNQIEDLYILENHADIVFDLNNHFNEVEVGTAGLTYTVVNVTGDTGIFSSLPTVAGDDTITLSFANDTPGFATVTVRADDGTSTPRDMTFTVRVNDFARMWISTEGNTSGIAGHGLAGWNAGEGIAFGDDYLDGNLQLEPASSTTDGGFSTAFSIPGVSIDALHYVQDASITVGGGANQFTLLNGDVIFSIELPGSSDTFNVGGVIANDRDVLVFRPDTPGDYSSGTFSMLLDDDLAPSYLNSISLVEHDMFIGDTWVSEGTFLYSRDADKESIWMFEATGVGVGSATSGTVTKLLDGSDGGMQFGQAIDALWVVSSTVDIGGVTLTPGQILVSLDKEDSDIGSNDLSVLEHDIFVLNVTSTDAGSGSSVATASLLFDGSDVGLTGNDGPRDVTAFTMAGQGAPPDAVDDSFSPNEGGFISDDVSTNDVLPADGDTHTYSLVFGPTYDSSFSFNSDGTFDYTHDGSENHTDYFHYAVDDGEGNVSLATVTLNAVPVNDDPVITSSSTTSVVENNTSVFFVTSSDVDGGAANYTISGGADQSRFSINPTTGLLTFNAAPDFELPSDVGTNNVYEVEVTVDDGNTGNDVQLVSVTVTDSTVLDEFNAVSYSGNDGPNNWSDQWHESGESDNPSSGRVRIVGGEVRIGGDNVSIDGRGLYREFDFSGATEATLSFNYHRQLIGNTSGSITLAIFDGVSWTNLSTYNLNGTDAVPVNEEFDISAFISADMQIRFLGSGSNISSYFFIDDVLIVDEAMSNNAPVITSNGGGDNAAVNVVENTTSVTTVAATDPDLDVPTFNISGGNDAGLFAIDGITGDLSFIAGPDFETNADFDADGVYEVEIQARDGNGGADTQLISVSIVDANDAPVLDNTGASTFAPIYENDITNTGDLVSNIIGSSGPDPITDQDGDPEGIAVVSVDNSNGTWEYSTDGGTSWNAFGNVTVSSAVVLTDTGLDRIRFVPNTNFNGVADIKFHAWDGTDGSSTGDTGVDAANTGGTDAFSVDFESASISVTPVSIVMNFATAGDVSGSGVAGLNSWSNSEILVLGDPNFSFEPGLTGGTVSTIYDLDDYASAAVSIEAIHEVSTDITVGGVNGTVDLLEGDILFAVPNNNVTFTGLDLVDVVAGKKDVIRFRPSDETFEMVFDEIGPPFVNGFTLVEVTTTVGDAVSNPGDVLLNVGNTKDILYLDPLGAGAGAAAGSTVTLIDGNEIGMGGGTVNIAGIDLIEDDISPGGATLLSGQIVATLDGDDFDVGNNNITVLASDIFYLDVTTTTMIAGTTDADATLLMEGGDINLGGGAEEITALSYTVEFGIQTGGLDPTIALPDVAVNYSEDDGPTIVDSTATFTDPDTTDFSSAQLFVDFTAGGTINDVLSINHQGFAVGQVGVVGSTVVYSNVSIGTISGGSNLVPLVVTFNSSATQASIQAVMQNVTFDNVSENPSETTRTVRFIISDGDGGTSNIDTESVNVMRENDAPTGINISSDDLDENIDTTGGVLVGTLLPIDPDSPDTFSYAVVGGPDMAAFSIGGALLDELYFDESLVDDGLLDFEDRSSYTIDVEVTDSGGIKYTETMTIDVNDLNDSPIVDDQTFDVDENVGNGSVVGAILASDLDVGVNGDMSFSLTGGTGITAFAVDSAGQITVADSAQLDFETTNSFTLDVEVTDGGTPGLTDTATLTINLNDLNEVPDITSDGGGATATVNVAEGLTAVTDVDATDPDLPADTLAYNITGGADAGMFMINSLTGQLDFIAAKDFETFEDDDLNGVYEVQVTVDDGSAFNDVQNISVTVTDQNDAPIITSDGGGATTTVNVAEGMTAVTNVDATDEDVPADTLTYTISGGADAALFTINGTTGELEFLAGKDFETFTDANSDGMYDIQVTVDDGNLGTDVQDISVTVTDVSETPVIVSDGGGAATNINVLENTTAVTDVDATDEDLPGDTLTYNITGGADQALFNINSSDGVLTFASGRDFETFTDADTNGTYEVQVTVDDGNGNSDVQNISVTVTNDNEAPKITSDGGGTTASINVMENTTAVTDVDAIDDDLPADTLSYNITGGADQGLFNINTSNGVLIFATGRDYETFTDADSNGIYEVQVTVDDGNGNTAVQDISVTVTNQNDAPSATISITAYGFDEDDPAKPLVGLSIADVDAGAGILEVTLSVNDGDLTLVTTTGLSFTGGANGSSTITFQGTLTDLNNALGSVTYQPDSAYAGTDTLTLFVDDLGNTGGPSLTDFDTASIVVTAVNAAPIITSDGGGATASLNVQENTTAVTTVTSTDADLDTATYSVSGGSDSTLFNIDSGSGVLTFVSGRDFETLTDANSDGIYEVEITVDDGNLGTDVQTLSVTVTNANEAPVIISNGGGATANLNVAENTTAVTTVTAFDVDAGATLTYSISGGADGADFTIDATTGELAFISSKDFETPADANLDNNYEVNVMVDDGNGGSDIQSITVSVTNGNETPTTVGILDLTDNEDPLIDPNSYDLHLAFDDTEDPDSVLFYSITGNTNPGLTTSITIDNTLDFIFVDFAPDQNGISDVTVRATDTGGLFVETTFRITVNPVNDNPYVDSPIGPVVVNEDAGDTVIDVSAVFDDVDIVTNADSITYSLVSNSDTGLVTTSFSGSDLTLDYADNKFGVATVTIRATDSFGRSVDESINVVVNSVQDLTVVGDDVLAPTSGGAITVNPLTLLANDFDIDSTLLNVNLDPGSEVGGVVTLDGTGSLVFTPNSNFIGTASFRYFVVADGLTSAPATVFVDVLPAVPPPPTPPTPDPTPDPNNDSDNDDDDGDDVIPPTVSVNTNQPADQLPETTTSVASEPLDSSLFVLTESASDEPVRLTEVAETHFVILTTDMRKSIDDSRQFTNSSFGSVDFLTTASWLWTDLDNLSNRMMAEGSLASFWSVATPSLATTMSVGYVMWLIKGGQIMAGLMAQVPAWKMIAIDPLPIIRSIEEEDLDVEGDSLASMVDDASDETEESDDESSAPELKGSW